MANSDNFFDVFVPESPTPYTETLYLNNPIDLTMMFLPEIKERKQSFT